MVRPSPTGGLSRLPFGHAEVLEDQAVVVGLAQGVQTVGLDAEMFIFLRRQIDHQDGRLAVDQHDDAGRPAGDDVGDEQLLAVEDVVVAVEHGRGAQGGQVGAGGRLGQGEAGQGLAVRQFRKKALLLLRRAEGAHGIHGADAAVDGGHAGDHGVERGHARQEMGEARERRALAAVLRVDEQAPVAGVAQLAQHRRRDLALLVQQRAGFAMPPHDGQRRLHRLVGRVLRRQRRRREQVERDLRVPDGLVNGAVGGLILFLEEAFDLFVRLVQGAGAARFLFGLAAQPQGGFGETLLIALGRRGRAHGRVLRERDEAPERRRADAAALGELYAMRAWMAPDWVRSFPLPLCPALPFLYNRHGCGRRDEGRNEASPMSKPYDATLKAMLEASPADWPRLAGFHVGRTEIMDADVSTITAATDKVLRLSGDLNAVMHFEFQAGPDAGLPGRVHGYNALLENRHGPPIHSVVVLLRPEADLRSITGRYEQHMPGAAEPYLMFRYQVIRVWRLPAEALLAGGLGTLPLAPIGAVTEADLPGVIVRLKEKLATPRYRKAAGALWTAVDVLMGLRYDRALVEQLLRGYEPWKNP